MSELVGNTPLAAFDQPVKADFSQPDRRTRLHNLRRAIWKHRWLYLFIAAAGDLFRGLQVLAVVEYADRLQGL